MRATADLMKLVIGMRIGDAPPPQPSPSPKHAHAAVLYTPVDTSGVYTALSLYYPVEIDQRRNLLVHNAHVIT